MQPKKQLLGGLWNNINAYAISKKARCRGQNFSERLCIKKIIAAASRDGTGALRTGLRGRITFLCVFFHIN